MKPQLRQIYLVLFMLCSIATIVVYYATDKNLTIFWILGICSIVLYLLYRFSKRK